VSKTIDIVRERMTDPGALDVCSATFRRVVAENTLRFYGFRNQFNPNISRYMKLGLALILNLSGWRSAVVSFLVISQLIDRHVK